MSPKDFRAELLKIMPGYGWTVHKSIYPGHLEATGIQTSGSNRLSTLSVVRVEREGEKPTYEAKSAGFGLRAKWLFKKRAGTLARALRGLQDHYESQASIYQSHAASLKQGRKSEGRTT